tara:strand:- start:14789 stop:15649 length:861 start_codon:yes stop_codon:yes gene_type:complete
MIYIVIPSLNEKYLIKSFLNDLHNQSYSKFKVIVSDNGSTDGTKEFIKEEYPNIKLIENNQSFWWTKSTNAGVEYALNNSQSSNDFILTINCDLSINHDYLESLISCSKIYNNSIIGSLTIDKESNKITFGGIRVNNFTAKHTRININKTYSNHKTSKDQESDLLPGRGTLIPVNVFKSIGMYDEMLPHYHADYEFSIRAKRNNFNLIVSHKSHVFSHAENSGLHFNNSKKLTLSELLKSFFILKSPNNLFRRGVFIYKTVPLRYFLFHLFFDYSRIISKTIIKQF